MSDGFKMTFCGPSRNIDQVLPQIAMIESVAAELGLQAKRRNRMRHGRFAIVVTFTGPTDAVERFGEWCMETGLVRDDRSTR